MNYKVLVIGDGIIDEYVYVQPQGKSPKENIITNRILRSESFKGGVWAAAKHVEGFCRPADIGYGPDVVTKRRFVEDGYVRKLFEVHEVVRQDWAMLVDAEDLSRYDLVVVADFGHGAVTNELIGHVERKAQFLAVNCQTNSSNLGFNLITKYKRADYVVLDELEARLAIHDRDSPIETVIQKLGFPRVVVTLGPRGSIGWDGDIHRSPALADRIVDTMGAGDAFFCVTAPLAKAGADMDTLLTVGNAAGAIKCGVIGHRASVNRESLVSYLSNGG